jgi:hypothetical protein
MKIMEENQKRIAIESEISRMGNEELDLIARLKNTQLLQQAAYEDLEGALAGKLGDSPMHN